jgi:hypothetical protein
MLIFEIRRDQGGAVMSATIVWGPGGQPATGLHVHVSDASPGGFYGRVTAVQPGAVTVARNDTGTLALVDLSRRRVMAVHQ